MILILAALCAASALSATEEAFGWHDRCLRPLLAAAVMVKNEVDVMPRTMAALARLNIGRLYVYDTGSTDGTQAMLRRDARERGIELFLLEGTFVDFAVSRNVLLDFAQGGSDWLLLLDAGEDVAVSGGVGVASIEQGLLRANASVCGIYVMQQWGQTQFYNVRLVRNRGVYRYLFPVHEFISNEGLTRSPCFEAHWEEVSASKLRIVQDRSVSGRSSAARWLRDAELLQGVLDGDPTDPRALFYLGRTYVSLEQCDLAVPVFQRRYNITQRGWWEEREVAALEITHCLLQRNYPDEALEWALRLYYGHRRIEGVVAVAEQALRQDDEAFCFALMTLACAPQLPKRKLFFEPRIYTHERWRLRQRCYDFLDLNADEYDAQEVRP